MIPAGFPSALSVGDALALRVFIPGIEIDGDLEVPPKDRHRARVVAPSGRRPFVQFYDTKRNELWEHHAGTTALAQVQGVEIQGDKDFTLPLRDRRILMNARFNLRRPVSVKRDYPIVKPDLDNLLKSVMDALVGNGILPDDNCVTDFSASKRYADSEHPIGVEVEITALPL